MTKKTSSKKTSPLTSANSNSVENKTLRDLNESFDRNNDKIYSKLEFIGMTSSYIFGMNDFIIDKYKDDNVDRITSKFNTFFKVLENNINNIVNSKEWNDMLDLVEGLMDNNNKNVEKIFFTEEEINDDTVNKNEVGEKLFNGHVLFFSRMTAMKKHAQMTLDYLEDSIKRYNEHYSKEDKK